MKYWLVMFVWVLSGSVYAGEHWKEPDHYKEVDVSKRFQTERDFHAHVYAWQPNMVPHSVVAYMDYDLNTAVDEALVFPYYSMNRIRSCNPEHRVKAKEDHLVFSICDSLNNFESIHQPYDYITTTKGWVCHTCIYEKIYGKMSVFPVAQVNAN